MLNLGQLFCLWYFCGQVCGMGLLSVVLNWARCSVHATGVLFMVMTLVSLFLCCELLSMVLNCGRCAVLVLCSGPQTF